MSRVAMLSLLGLLWGADAKEEVLKAVQKLQEASGYSWTSTPAMGGGGGGAAGRFLPGPTTGKTEKDGYTLVSMSAGQTATEAALKGGKVAVKTADEWKGAEELAAARRAAGDQPQPGADRPRRGDPAAFAAIRLRNFKAPAAEAADLVAEAKELKEEGGAYVGELTEEGVKARLAFGGRGRRGGDAQGQGPQVSGAKGSVKFWVQGGVLVKYEYTVQGKVTFGDREIDMNRTATVEIKDIGSTKVEVPEDARKKLE